METIKPGWTQFEKEWTKRIVSSINRVRTAANLTVNDLADRLRSLGWPVSNATLSGMLSGNKRSSVSVAEAAAFARALNVSPLFLILGLPEAEQLPDGDLWGDTAPYAHRVQSWFSGNRTLYGIFPEDAANWEAGNAAYDASKAATFSLTSIRAIASHLEQIDLQAAQLVAFRDFEPDQFEAALHRSPDDRSILNEAIARLANELEMQRQMTIRKEGWLVPAPPLPKPLQPLESGDSVDAEDFSFEDLELLTRPSTIEGARENAQAIIDAKKRLELSEASGEQSGSPA